MEEQNLEEEQTSEEQQLTDEERQNKYNELGAEFNKKITDVFAEFEPVLPVFFMIKILQNLTTDLFFKQVGYQIGWALRKEEESKAKKILL